MVHTAIRSTLFVIAGVHFLTIQEQQDEQKLTHSQIDLSSNSNMPQEKLAELGIQEKDLQNSMKVNE